MLSPLDMIERTMQTGDWTGQVEVSSMSVELGIQEPSPRRLDRVDGSTTGRFGATVGRAI